MKVNMLHIFFLVFKAIRIDHYLKFYNIKITPFNSTVPEMVVKAWWNLCATVTTHTVIQCSSVSCRTWNKFLVTLNFLVSVCVCVTWSKTIILTLFIILWLSWSFLHTTEKNAESKILFKKSYDNGQCPQNCVVHFYIMFLNMLIFLF
jgi:hypothetical protein